MSKSVIKFNLNDVVRDYYGSKENSRKGELGLITKFSEPSKYGRSSMATVMYSNGEECLIQLQHLEKIAENKKGFELIKKSINSKKKKSFALDNDTKKRQKQETVISKVSPDEEVSEKQRKKSHSVVKGSKKKQKVENGNPVVENVISFTPNEMIQVKSPSRNEDHVPISTQDDVILNKFQSEENEVTPNKLDEEEEIIVKGPPESSLKCCTTDVDDTPVNNIKKRKKIDITDCCDDNSNESGNDFMDSEHDEDYDIYLEAG